MPLTCESLSDTSGHVLCFNLESLTYLAQSIVCPNCSNALTISRGEATSRHPLGANRFECRTCPYQYVLDQSWYEKTPMKQKEVEDVFGGKEEFANADSMASKFLDIKKAAGLLGDID